MADALTELDLGDLHDAIVAGISAQFPALQTVEFYREEDDRKTPASMPACLLELTEFEKAGADPDPGTGQLAVMARFEARLIIGFRTPNAKREIRKLACAFASFVHLRRWEGVVTGPGEVVGIYHDDFSPELDQYEVWRVEWAHVIHLGESVWKPDGSVAPTNVTARPAHPEGEAPGEAEQVTPDE